MTTTPSSLTPSAPTEGLASADTTVPPASSSPVEDRLERIRRGAYTRYEQRGYEAGHEEEDWLAAEAEVDSAPDPAVSSPPA